MQRLPVLMLAATLFAADPVLAQPTDVRTIDGSGNNLNHPEWGQAGTLLRREAPADYPGDGSGSTIIGDPDRPNPRAISNAVCTQTGDMPNAGRMSDMVWQWGQFIDHDLDLTPIGDEGSGEPGGDASFFLRSDPTFSPPMDFFVPFTRSNFTGSPREHSNDITAWIDASNVYGSDADRAESLRDLTNDDGLLRTSEGGLLLPREGGDWFAGDIRAGEQIGLTAMHTLFVREHNRLAREIKQRRPRWSGDDIYQLARKIVGAELQIVTYEEFLPALLGWRAPNRLGGWTYDADLDPSITTEFATSLYRVGHTMLSPNLALVDDDNEQYGSIALRDAFFTDRFTSQPGLVDDVLRGLAAQPAQEIDAKVVEDVRSFLFGMGMVGLDLPALNIQRGRDHGIPDYNTLRQAYGLRKARDFADITEDPEVQEELKEMFHDVDNIDPWVGAICEDHIRGNCNVGQLLATAIRDQFERVRTGDRFFWKRDSDLKTPIVRRVIDLYRVKLSDIIRWNTSIGNELPDNVFQVQ